MYVCRASPSSGLVHLRSSKLRAWNDGTTHCFGLSTCAIYSVAPSLCEGECDAFGLGGTDRGTCRQTLRERKSGVRMDTTVGHRLETTRGCITSTCSARGYLVMPPPQIRAKVKVYHLRWTRQDAPVAGKKCSSLSCQLSVSCHLKIYPAASLTPCQQKGILRWDLDKLTDGGSGETFDACFASSLFRPTGLVDLDASNVSRRTTQESWVAQRGCLLQKIGERLADENTRRYPPRLPPLLLPVFTRNNGWT